MRDRLKAPNLTPEERAALQHQIRVLQAKDELIQVIGNAQWIKVTALGFLFMISFLVPLTRASWRICDAPTRAIWPT